MQLISATKESYGEGGCSCKLNSCSLHYIACIQAHYSWIVPVHITYFFHKTKLLYLYLKGIDTPFSCDFIHYFMYNQNSYLSIWKNRIGIAMKNSIFCLLYIFLPKDSKASWDESNVVQKAIFIHPSTTSTSRFSWKYPYLLHTNGQRVIRGTCSYWCAHSQEKIGCKTRP